MMNFSKSLLIQNLVWALHTDQMKYTHIVNGMRCNDLRNFNLVACAVCNFQIPFLLPCVVCVCVCVRSTFFTVPISNWYFAFIVFRSVYHKIIMQYKC